MPRIGSHPPRAVCLQPVRFNPQIRQFEHLGLTWCRGIDGMVLDVPYREWVIGRANEDDLNHVGQES